MSWPWKRKLSKPFSDDFTINVIEIDDPGVDNPAEHIIPYDTYAQLVSVTYSILLGPFPTTHVAVVEAFRGGTRLYVSASYGPSSDIGTRMFSFGVCHENNYQRNASWWNTAPLLDHFYLYPGDLVRVIGVSAGALNYTLTNVILTFKTWVSL